MLSTELQSGWPFAHTRAWERILRSIQREMSGPDATCAPVWAQALAATQLKDCEIRTRLVSRDSQIVAIAPTFMRSSGRFPLRKRELRLVTEAHAGRTALLAENNDPEIVRALLSSMLRESPAWDVFVLSVVAGSPGHTAVVDAAGKLGLPLRCLAMQDSPYIQLPATWDALLAALPKKMRWTIRKGEKDLMALGALTYEEMAAPADVPRLLAAIYAIEQQSWKEQSGTSITAQDAQRAFYESFVELAAQAGILSAHVLSVAGKPVAYILGIAAGDGVFLDQKESFDLAFSEYSPGHVLKRYAIQTLLARGVRLYDLMGVCEPYKMRWTDKTYTRLTLALFNKTLGGRLSYVRALLGRVSKPLSA